MIVHDYQGFQAFSRLFYRDAVILLCLLRLGSKIPDLPDNVLIL